MDIGNIIKIGLDRKKLSQAELAREMGLTRASISKWVGGENIPPGDKLVKIIKILDLVPDLFPESFSEKKEKEIDFEYIRGIAREEAIKEIIKFENMKILYIKEKVNMYDLD